MRTSLLLAAAATIWGMPALAASPHVEGAVYRERTIGGERLIEPADQLKSGDKVVLLVRWQAAGDRTGFTVTTPVPAALAYQRDSSDAVEVSTDGGRTWTSSTAPGGRVTHLRWKVGARVAASGSGSFTYSAFVR